MILKGAQPLLTLKGIFNVRHMRGNKCLSNEDVSNTITTAGFAEVAGLINEVTSIGFKWLAIGSSATAASNANTALAGEITSPSLSRVSATTSRVTTSETNDTAQSVNTYSSTATQAVQEVGLFDSSSSGVMLSRATFSAKNLVSGDTLQITHKVQVQ
jgi:hypothetical protein